MCHLYVYMSSIRCPSQINHGLILLSLIYWSLLLILCHKNIFINYNEYIYTCGVQAHIFTPVFSNTLCYNATDFMRPNFVTFHLVEYLLLQGTLSWTKICFHCYLLLLFHKYILQIYVFNKKNINYESIYAGYLRKQGRSWPSKSLL